MTPSRQAHAAASPRTPSSARGFMLLALPTLLSCSSGFADPAREFAPAAEPGGRHPEIIRTPSAEGLWYSPLKDDPTLPQVATCDTCHGPVPKNFLSARPGEVFHTDVDTTHGNLACGQCHDADRTRLHLADGRLLDFSQVMQLCSQCHGPQASDFAHGAHGGKSGYWDPRRGPATRDNCVDCHDAHAPSYPAVQPVLAPRDRTPGGH